MGQVNSHTRHVCTAEFVVCGVKRTYRMRYHV
jgi:hypothetical protein